MRAARCATFCWLVGGEVTGLCFLESGGLPQVRRFCLAEGLSSWRRTQTYYTYSLGAWGLGLCPIAALLLLDSSSLASAFPRSLISYCLNLHFGTPVRSRRLNETYFLQTRNWGQGKDLYLGGPPQDPAQFQKLVFHGIMRYFVYVWKISKETNFLKLQGKSQISSSTLIFKMAYVLKIPVKFYLKLLG